MRAKQVFAIAAAVAGIVVLAEPAQAGPPFQPEAMVKSAATGKWVGNNVYDPDDFLATGQYTGVFADQGDKIKFRFRAGNDGPGKHKVLVFGASSSFNLSITYKKGTQNVTSAVTGAGYQTAKLEPGKFETLTVIATVSQSAPDGFKINFGVDVVAAGYPLAGDGIRFFVDVPSP